MGTQYDLTNEEPLTKMVQDDTTFVYSTREQVIASDIVEPSDLPPYTLEEINARIDNAEEQIARGDVFSHEEVMTEVRDLIASWV